MNPAAISQQTCSLCRSKLTVTSLPLLVFDGVFYLLHAENAAFGVQLKGYNVDALVFGGFRVFLEVGGRGSADVGGLAARNRFLRRAEGRAATAAHLDEDDLVRLRRDQVDLKITSAIANNVSSFWIGRS